MVWCGVVLHQKLGSAQWEFIAIFPCIFLQISGKIVDFFFAGHLQAISVQPINLVGQPRPHFCCCGCLMFHAHPFHRQQAIGGASRQLRQCSWMGQPNLTTQDFSQNTCEAPQPMEASTLRKDPPPMVFSNSNLP